MEKTIKDLSSELSDTLLLITADHGHMDSKNLCIRDYPEVLSCLVRMPSIEPRTLNLFVKEECMDSFPAVFRKNFGDEAIITAENITKGFKIYYDKGHNIKERALYRGRGRYEKREVLKGISFEVRKGEAVGLIGSNGCGKSTTLKLLTGIMYPDSGSIRMKGRVSAAAMISSVSGAARRASFRSSMPGGSSFCRRLFRASCFRCSSRPSKKSTEGISFRATRAENS